MFDVKKLQGIKELKFRIFIKLNLLSNWDGKGEGVKSSLRWISRFAWSTSLPLSLPLDVVKCEESFNKQSWKKNPVTFFQRQFDKKTTQQQFFKLNNQSCFLIERQVKTSERNGRVNKFNKGSKVKKVIANGPRSARALMPFIFYFVWTLYLQKNWNCYSIPL